MSQVDLDELMQALKVAFCYMPKAIEVNRYDHGDRVEDMLRDIELVRATLLRHGIDPEEVPNEIYPERGGPSSM